MRCQSLVEREGGKNFFFFFFGLSFDFNFESIKKKKKKKFRAECKFSFDARLVRVESNLKNIYS